jgi:hypothetical protein
MAFWDFFSDKKKDDLPPGKKTHYQGDLVKTDILNKLFQTPRTERGAEWKQRLFANVADAALRCANPQIIKGPDDFPYFILFPPDPYQPFQAYTIRHMIDDFLLDSGYGVVINPKGNQADWVFSYGDLVNFHINGEFYSNSTTPQIEDKEILEKDEKILISQPSEKYLPKKARSVIRDFLKSMGIEKPQVMLVTRTINEIPVQELAFNLQASQFATAKHFDFTIEHLSWFLPKHYIILTFPEGSAAQTGFSDL